jgi:hypothetical protein
MENDQPLIPEQRVGVQKDSRETVGFESVEAARAFFQIARERLLHVSHWHELCDGPSATFQLRDATGTPVDRPSQVGDYFQIDVPGPGTRSGEGTDWVRIEALEDCRDDAYEVTSLRVRPAPSPLNDQPDVAHFFSDSATSTFVVQRTGLTVSAEVHGRNEVPNADAENVIDKVRNVATAVGAFLGLADMQWGTLVKALVRRDS